MTRDRHGQRSVRVVHDGKVYVIEVNPRSSRTVPYISKVTDIPMVDLATRIMTGATLRSWATNRA